MIKKGASNIEVKRANRNKIFRYINKNKRVSKPEIVAALKISMPTILQNVNELISEGLIEEVGEFESTGGRKATAISPIYGAKYAIGIDITRNHIGLVLTNLSGEVLQHMRVHQPYANDLEYYHKLSKTALEFKERYAVLDENFLGFGISIPGIVDTQKERIVFSHALSISNIPFQVFVGNIPYSTMFINDADASAVSEIYNADESYNAVYISLSNSVGGAIISKYQSYHNENMTDNKFYNIGDNWRSGEFGHVTLIPRGKKCYCGKEGCFDSYCSAISLAQHTDGKLEKFFEEIKNENKEFWNIWEEYLFNLATQVNNLRMIFDCNVIIGGYVGSFIEPYMYHLKDKVAKLNTFEQDASYVKPCCYKIEAAALGAALNQIESFISTI